MRPLLPELKAELAREVSTICHCFDLQRTDGKLLHFTNHDLPLLIHNQLYEPQSGFTPSDLKQEFSFATGGQDVSGVLSSDRISRGDIHAKLYDNATVTTWLVNWRNPTVRSIIAKGKISQISLQDDQFHATLTSPNEILQRIAGRIYGNLCDAALGGNRCRVDLSDEKYSSRMRVIFVENRRELKTTLLEQRYYPPGHFSDGSMLWNTGSNQGQRQLVSSHTVHETIHSLKLERDGSHLPAVDDILTVTVGCDHQYQTCRDKFANQLNYQGFRSIPGADAAIAGIVTK